MRDKCITGDGFIFQKMNHIKPVDLETQSQKDKKKNIYFSFRFRKASVS